MRIKTNTIFRTDENILFEVVDDGTGDRELEKIITEIHQKSHGMSGLIVALKHNDRIEAYWTDHGHFDSVDSGYPRIYRSVGFARRKMIDLNENEAGENRIWAMFLYLSGSEDIVPLEKYVKMSGSRFPGSPTQ